MVPAMRSILFSHIKLKQREFSCREDTTDLLIYTDFIYYIQSSHAQLSQNLKEQK